MMPCRRAMAMLYRETVMQAQLLAYTDDFWLLALLFSTDRAGDLPITYRGTVHQWHCDHMGHMNVMWYVGKFDEATWVYLTLLGLTRLKRGRVSFHGEDITRLLNNVRQPFNITSLGLVAVFYSFGGFWEASREPRMAPPPTPR